MKQPPTTATVRVVLTTIRAGLAFDAHTCNMTATQAADWLDRAIHAQIAREQRIAEIEAAHKQAVQP